MKLTRKYVLTVMALVAATVLCWYGKVTGHDWVWFVSGVILTHHAANVTDKGLGGAG